jgi:phosphatidate cytidylyltransferase
LTDHASRRPSFGTNELAARIASALVLATVTVLVTWSGVVSFAQLVAAVGAILSWEWSRLVRGASCDGATVAAALAIAAAIALVVAGYPGAGLLLLPVAAIALAVANGAGTGRLAALGVMYAGLPCVALVWLRAAGSYGFESILLIFIIVWATDTGAFIAGRNIGGPRLWASVSPNKTWAGLAGGVLASAVLSWGYAVWIASSSPGRVLVLAGVLAVISQMGDLMESALKRAHGVKDTSSLIPGHGGFMDRVDGLIFAAVAAALYAWAVDPGSPGTALLAIN